MAGGIFINYRRGDQPGFAGRLYDRLMQAFPGERLFMDVDDIPPGSDFVEVLDRRVRDCDVLLALIGDAWLSALDSQGGRRLERDDDFVRIEIALALEQNKLVMPILVGGTAMPREEQLPPSLKLLARRNAVRVTHERFNNDCDGLIRALREFLEQTTQRDHSRSAWRWRSIFGLGSSGSRRMPARRRLGLRISVRLVVTFMLMWVVVLGSYYAFTSGKHDTVGTVAALTAEQLANALEERRKADVAAAEKKRLEEEAQRKAAADAEAKSQAAIAFAEAQRERQAAEDELARLKSDMEAREKEQMAQRELAEITSRRALVEAERKNRAQAEIAALRQAQEEARRRAAADAAAKKADDEAVQRRAAADAAARRDAEEKARAKAAAEAETKRQADEALAEAQVERQRADEEAARQKAELEARQKTEADATAKTDADAKARAEAAAKAKADADAAARSEADAAAAKKVAEALEFTLKLTPRDRQHIQIALTSLGFDTRGIDGVFGPRTREMIARWQTARSQPTTGFLDAGQRQILLKEAADAIKRYDDELRRIDEAKRAEEEARNKAQEEAKKKEEEERRKAADVWNSPPPELTDEERQRQKARTDAVIDLILSAPQKAR